LAKKHSIAPYTYIHIQGEQLIQDVKLIEEEEVELPGHTFPIFYPPATNGSHHPTCINYNALSWPLSEDLYWPLVTWCIKFFQHHSEQRATWNKTVLALTPMQMAYIHSTISVYETG
jgi:hypothetical protein